MTLISNLKHLSVLAGANYNNQPVTVAKNGFTAVTYGAPIAASSLTSSLRTLADYTARPDSLAQTITIPSLDVTHRNQYTLPLRPTHGGLFRQTVSTAGTAIEPMVDDSRDTYQPTSLTIGEDDLDLIGEIPLISTGTIVTKLVANSEISTTVGITDSAISSLADSVHTGGGLPFAAASADQICYAASGVAAAASPSDGLFAPMARVIVTIAAGMNYGKLVIRRGGKLPSDDLCIDENGTSVKFSEVDGLVDALGNLLHDYLLDDTKLTFVQDFVSPSLAIPAGSVVPEGLVISLQYFKRTYDGDSGVLTYNDNYDVVDTSVASGRYRLVYPFGAAPTFSLTLPKGSKIESPVELTEGSSLVGGFVFPELTSFSTVDFLDHVVTLEKVIAEPGFQIPSDATLTEVIGSSQECNLPSGVKSTVLTTLPVGTHSSGPLNFSTGVIFGLNSQAPVKMTLHDSVPVEADIVLEEGSKIAVGSTLPKGSQSLEGAVIKEALSFNNSSMTTSDYDVNAPFTIEANSTLKSGMQLRNAVLPIGTVLTANNILPAHLKVLVSMGYSMTAGTEIPVGSVFGSGFQLSGDTGFEPKSVIPAQSSITGTFTLPSKTVLKAGFVLAQQDLPVPVGTQFKIGTVLTKGMSFDYGSQLPVDFNVDTQVPEADLTATLNAALALIDDSTGNTGKKYLRVADHSPLLEGFLLKKGSMFSRKIAGNTLSHSDAIDTGAAGAAAATHDAATHVALHLDPAEYSLSSAGSPAADPIDIYSGVPLSYDIYLLSDISSDREFLQVYEGESSYLAHVRLSQRLTLAYDMTVSSAPYKVTSSSTVFWPKGHGLPQDFVLSASVALGSAGVQTFLNKEIQFNVDSNEEFVHGIIGSTSVLKMPAQQYTSQHKYEVSAGGVAVSATGPYASRAPIDLPVGTKLSGNVKLVQPMSFEGAFTLGADIDTHPRFVSQGGIRLFAGQNFPGNIIIQPGQPLPRGLSLPIDVTLAADYVIHRGQNLSGHVTYTIGPIDDVESGRVVPTLAAGSEIEEDSVFVDGLEIQVPVTFEQLKSLRTVSQFSVYQEQVLSSSISYPHFYGDNGPKFNSNMSLVQIKELMDQLASLEAQLQAHA